MNRSTRAIFDRQVQRRDRPILGLVVSRRHYLISYISLCISMLFGISSGCGNETSSEFPETLQNTKPGMQQEETLSKGDGAPNPTPVPNVYVTRGEQEGMGNLEIFALQGSFTSKETIYIQLEDTNAGDLSSLKANVYNVVATQQGSFAQIIPDDLKKIEFVSIHVDNEDPFRVKVIAQKQSDKPPVVYKNYGEAHIINPDLSSGMARVAGKIDGLDADAPIIGVNYTTGDVQTTALDQKNTFSFDIAYSEGDRLELYDKLQSGSLSHKNSIQKLKLVE